MTEAEVCKEKIYSETSDARNLLTWLIIIFLYYVLEIYWDSHEIYKNI